MAKAIIYLTLVVLVSLAYANESEECPDYPPTNPDPAYNEGDPCFVTNPLCHGYYAPHPINCFQFLQCMHGRFAPRNCSPGMHWNHQAPPAGACDWPANVNCQGQTTLRTTTGAPATTASSF